MVNLRNRTVLFVVAWTLVALVAGCESVAALGSSPEQPTPVVSEAQPSAVTTITVAPETVQASEPTQAPPPTEEPPAVTITGQVKSVAASARVINLTDVVEGFNIVALTDATQFISKDDSVKSLADIKPGMKIEAAGKPGSPGSVLASKIRILAAPAPAASTGQWQRVQILGPNLSFEVPAGWKQQGKLYAWANPKANGQRVGINSMERKGGVEPTSILPEHAVSLDAAPVELKWGQGTKHTVEVTSSAGGGGSSVAVETHVIVLTDKFVVDVYASAATPEELDALWPTVQHMLDSVK